MRYTACRAAAALVLGALLRATSGNAQSPPGADRAAIEPWLGAALGAAPEGVATVVSVGALLSAQLGIGAEWQRTAPLAGDTEAHTRAMLGTAHWVVGRAATARFVVRARVGREAYAQAGRTTRGTLAGGGLALVLLPHRSYSPVLAWDHAWRQAGGDLAPRTTRSLVVGLLVH